MSYLFVCMIASLSEDCDIKIYWKGLFFILYANSTVLAWLSCNALVSINVVIRLAQLVLEWVTACQVNHPGRYVARSRSESCKNGRLFCLNRYLKFVLVRRHLTFNDRMFHLCSSSSCVASTTRNVAPNVDIRLQSG